MRFMISSYKLRQYVTSPNNGRWTMVKDETNLVGIWSSLRQVKIDHDASNVGQNG